MANKSWGPVFAKVFSIKLRKRAQEKKYLEVGQLRFLSCSITDLKSHLSLHQVYCKSRPVLSSYSINSNSFVNSFVAAKWKHTIDIFAVYQIS